MSVAVVVTLMVVAAIVVVAIFSKIFVKKFQGYGRTLVGRSEWVVIIVDAKEED